MLALRATLAYRGAPERARAGVAELVDAPDLGSGIERCGGSSPFARTSRKREARGPGTFFQGMIG